jgi:hypothetical protein
MNLAVIVFIPLTPCESRHALSNNLGARNRQGGYGGSPDEVEFDEEMRLNHTEIEVIRWQPCGGILTLQFRNIQLTNLTKCLILFKSESPKFPVYMCLFRQPDVPS